MHFLSKNTASKTGKFKNHNPLSCFIRNTLLMALASLPCIASADPVRFSSHYKIKVKQKHLFDIGVEKDQENHQVQISIQPVDNNGDIGSHTPSDCDGTCHISKWDQLFWQINRKANTDGPGISPADLFNVLYHSLFITPGQDQFHSGAIQSFTASFNEAGQSDHAVQYTLAGQSVAQMSQTQTAGHVQTSVPGSGQVVTADSQGSLVSMPYSELPTFGTADGDEAALTTLGEATTWSNQADETLLDAIGRTTEQTMVMLGTGMEQLFNTLVNTGVSGSSSLIHVVNPLSPVIMGGNLIPMAMVMDDPEFQQFLAVPHLNYQQDTIQVFSYDPESSTISQSDPADDPCPSNVIFQYHIDGNNVIDQITVTEHQTPIITITSTEHEQTAGATATAAEPSSSEEGEEHTTTTTSVEALTAAALAAFAVASGSTKNQ